MVVGQGQTELLERFQGSIVDSVLSAPWIASTKHEVAVSLYHCLQPRVCSGFKEFCGKCRSFQS